MKGRILVPTPTDVAGEPLRIGDRGKDPPTQTRFDGKDYTRAGSPKGPLIPSEHLRVVASAVERWLVSNGAERVRVAGSIRRERKSAHDIDILCIARDERVLSDQLRASVPKDRLLWSGANKVSFVLDYSSDEIMFTVQVDVRFIPRDSWGPALQYFTGSWEHNVSLRRIAIGKGLKLSEYGLFDVSGKRIDNNSEESIYQLLGLRWLPPKYREGYIQRNPWEPIPSWCVDHLVKDFCKRERRLAHLSKSRQSGETSPAGGEPASVESYVSSCPGSLAEGNKTSENIDGGKA